MDADNPVQSEYIIMEEAAGVQLSQVWDTLPIESKLDIVKDLVNIEKKLLSISFIRFVSSILVFFRLLMRRVVFIRYGSLYFTDQGFLGCVKAQVVGDVSASLIAEIESRYVIGPMADGDFWTGERKNMAIDRGPCECLKSY